jgi:hypothetical protein
VLKKLSFKNGANFQNFIQYFQNKKQKMESPSFWTKFDMTRVQEALNKLEVFSKCSKCSKIPDCDKEIFSVGSCCHQLCQDCYTGLWSGSCPVCGQATDHKDVRMDRTTMERVKALAAIKAQIGAPTLPPASEAGAGAEDFVVVRGPVQDVAAAEADDEDDCVVNFITGDGQKRPQLALKKSPALSSSKADLDPLKVLRDDDMEISEAQEKNSKRPSKRPPAAGPLFAAADIAKKDLKNKSGAKTRRSTAIADSLTRVLRDSEISETLENNNSGPLKSPASVAKKDVKNKKQPSKAAKVIKKNMSTNVSEPQKVLRGDDTKRPSAKPLFATPAAAVAKSGGKKQQPSKAAKVIKKKLSTFVGDLSLDKAKMNKKNKKGETPLHSACNKVGVLSLFVCGRCVFVCLSHVPGDRR